MRVAVIGGGAAGFFAALSCKKHYPDAEVTIYEKSNKLLAKVKVSGGGRCNVTHGCEYTSQLAKNYPRGERFLKKAFSQFAVSDTIDWFEERGVKLKTEPDGRMFPVTNNSQTIIDCFLENAKRSGVMVATRVPIESIKKRDNQFILNNDVMVDKVIVASGGSPKESGLQWLKELGHQIAYPVPSLFTFNIPQDAVTKLMGLSVKEAIVKVQGTKLTYSGPLLITHWGLSGPAVLKTSAWGARLLNDKMYDFTIGVNWVGEPSENTIREKIGGVLNASAKKKVANSNIYDLPSRLWLYLLDKIDLRVDITCGELGNKSINRLVNVLYHDVYSVKGKTTFKDEFVTCGGVSLTDINSKTMESKVVPGLYFAGEVMDIDGITGGFNFQAAWTTGYIAGKLHSNG